MLAYESGNAVATRHSSSSELVIRSENIDSDTEFLILASNGIWEVSYSLEYYSEIF
jgi:protein phosphatase PTC1